MTLQELTTAIAKANPGMAPDTVSRFVNAFFASVTESLIKDGNVKISGFGTFVHTEEPRHQVSFIPAEEMADTVNAPFSMFEPEELADDVTDEMLESGNAGEQKPEPEATEQQDEPETVPETEATVSEPSEPVTEQTMQEPEPQPKSMTEPEDHPEPEPEPEETAEENDENEDNTEKETVIVYRNVFPWWYALIAGLVAGVIIGGAILYTHFDRQIDYSDEDEYTEENALLKEMTEDLAQAEAATSVTTDNNTEATQPADTVQVSEANEPEPEIREVKPAEPEVITETVSPRNYLTTMAKRHYGKDVFWVYIYMENSDKLKHPDRIRPNTVVVIPPASKYGIDKNDPKSVAAAKQKGNEIYSKYK